MSYGLKYTGQFDSFKPLQSYRVDIFQKDYDGDSTPILLSGTPVIQEWQDDDPKSPIRGCTLKVSIITDLRGVKLSDFYSEDDSEFYIEFYCTDTDQYLFKGYLLQDDCQEIQLDFNHEIGLTFTDMLGTLKDITINQAAEIVGTLTTETGITFTNPSPIINFAIITNDNIVGVLKVGDKFTIYDGTNTYNLTCYSILYNIGTGWVIGINEPCPFAGTITADFTYTIPYPLTGYIPLIDVLKLCLKSTLLDIGLRSLVSIFPEGTGTTSVWDATFIDANTLREDENNWMNCYDVLEKLMQRFNASLFQCNAEWHIVRWDEMYRYITAQGATMRGYGYDSDFVGYSDITNVNNFTFMDGSDMETGVLKSINRPFQYVKESFNYVQPTDLLKNPNLQELGDLLREYIDANNDLIKEYVAPYWISGSAIPGNNYETFIRIAYNNDSTSDNFGDEKYRNLVITNDGANQAEAARSNYIYLSKGDSINYSVHIETGYSYNGPAELSVIIYLFTASGTYIYDRYGHWVLSGTDPQRIYLTNSQDLNDGLDWSIVNADPLPEDGALQICLFDYNSNPSQEIYYKDFNFSVRSFYAGYSQVVGQTHTYTQTKQIKNNDSKEISFDNSPSWYIKGTFFLSSSTGLLRDKTIGWGYPLYSPIPIPDRFAYSSLGKATTQESLFTRYRPRAKYEGNYLKVLKGTGPYTFVNPMSVFMINTSNRVKFVVGKLAIDYKNAMSDLTLYELIDLSGAIEFNLIHGFRLWKDGNIYEFNYLFENK